MKSISVLAGLQSRCSLASSMIPIYSLKLLARFAIGSKQVREMFF